jgi:ADP-ribose pyrophosphatase
MVTTREARINEPIHASPMASYADSEEVVLTTSRFFIVRHRLTTTDGATVIRETVQHPGAAVVVPLFDDGRVCLVKNYRVAVKRTLIELPAGTLDPGETPIAAATRELAEETGYSAALLEPLAELVMSPGILNERTHVFIATGLSSGTASPEPGEEIETLIVPCEEALAMIDDGRIQDAKTVAALLLYDRRRMRNAE